MISSPAGTDQRAGAVACALITVVLASTASQLPSPGSTSGATSSGASRLAATVNATSPATSPGPMPTRRARTAYHTDQPVSAATAASSSDTRTGGVRTASAVTAPNSPQVNRSSAGRVVKMSWNAPPAGRSSNDGDEVGAERADIWRGRPSGGDLSGSARRCIDAGE